MLLLLLLACSSTLFYRSSCEVLLRVFEELKVALSAVIGGLSTPNCSLIVTYVLQNLFCFTVFVCASCDQSCHHLTTLVYVYFLHQIQVLYPTTFLVFKSVTEGLSATQKCLLENSTTKDA